MFAPCGRFLGTTGFARGAPLKEIEPFFSISKELKERKLGWKLAKNRESAIRIIKGSQKRSEAQRRKEAKKSQIEHVFVTVGLERGRRLLGIKAAA
jgi:hypothetical protein